jgi:hypothetical protein
MVDVLFDVYLTQALIQNTSRYAAPEQKDSLLAGVLSKHSITQAQLDSSIVWYSSQAEVYSKINERVSKRLAEFQKQVAPSGNIEQYLRKKYDGFTLPPSVTLAGISGISVFSFRLDSLKFTNIDTAAFDFNFKVLGVLPQSKVKAGVCFEYKDTTIRQEIRVDRNKYYSFQKPNRMRHPLRNISGYIRMEDPEKIFAPVLIYDLSYKKIVPKVKRKPVQGEAKPKSPTEQKQKRIEPTMQAK